MLDASAPFALFDYGRDAGAVLYRNPHAVLRADRPEEVDGLLASLREALAGENHVAGMLSFEAGLALEPRLRPLGEGAPPPLGWFGLFPDAERIDDLAAILPPPGGAWAGEPRPTVTRETYEAMVADALQLIAAGEIYQANLTFPCAVRLAGHPLALYARLRAAAGVRWGGVLFDGARWLLSLSPEMFFMIEGREVSVRPMKGTAVRRADPAEDVAAAAALAADEKQRAENLMIVDLMRNDLSRVAEPGSVAVPSLFQVETYPTVHQMTSTVTGRLEEGRDAVDLLRALYPCGSITGAPKIRSMEAIAALEAAARGAYTGSMGWLAPGGSGAFNILIRTLELQASAKIATLGLGAGIVADSDPGAEWDECLHKGRFIGRAMRPFDLFETMRFVPEAGLPDLELHLERLLASAEALDFAFDRHHARNELQAATFRLSGPATVRLRLARTGGMAIEVRAAPAAPGGPVAVALVPLPVHPSDFRLRHKTSDRRFYDEPRRATGAFEVAFVDPEGFVTEGSFTSLFILRDGMLATPPLARGLLPGVLRRRLIEEGQAIESDIRQEELGYGFYLGNSVRGLIDAVVAGSAGDR